MDLVTGATGYVGSRLVRRLAAEGRGVRALARRPERVERLPGVEPVGADLLGTAPLALMASHDAERRYVGTAIVAIRGNIRDWFWRRVEEMRGPPPKGLKKPATQWVAPGLIGRVRYLKGEEYLLHATLKDVRDERR